MVTLNYAVAVAMVHGAPAGLEVLDMLQADSRISTHYRLSAVKAHLLKMSGDHENAIKRYREAAAKTSSLPERNYLLTQAAQLAGKV